ncbi:alkaline phosphatase [Actomonas aquatica]|uniref:Alkaline phosphatase n=1 Tax=Actomonas aquatica TaxID=2866162 RepID=A0ABZ1C3K1_9BACT|nr:alkaline phosphatase [Opitutus sp. WL0086]WRQ85937.1 alkaline phosphatase [Opitutus sp. WL0086]
MRPSLSLCFAFLLCCSVATAASPRNLILVIGDGMGWDHLVAGRLRQGDVETPLVMERLPVGGHLSTAAAGSHRITDSAASATAMSTGFKTSNGRVGTLSDGRAVPTLFETLRARGWSLGIVTDGDLNGATAGAFTAHVDSRDAKAAIAAQMLALAPDVMVGTTAEFPLDGATAAGVEVRQDRPLAALDLPGGAASVLIGYTAMIDEAASLEQRMNVAGLAAPTLAEATDFALGRLAARKRPFMLLLENDWIDSWSHENDFELLADSVSALDAAVAVALAFAQADGETLVVVTADHECGGLTLPEDAHGAIVAHFSTEKHTAATVPLFAFGPGAERFAGAHDNTAIRRLLLELVQD